MPAVFGSKTAISDRQASALSCGCPPCRAPTYHTAPLHLSAILSALTALSAVIS